MTNIISNYKRAIGAFLILCLLAISCFGSYEATFAENDDSNKSSAIINNGYVEALKDEVIYANMDNEGTVHDLYVVNVLDMADSGSVRDHGDYTKVVNLTDTSEIDNENGQITINTDSDKFYYEGYVDEYNLPWHISLDYTLDGEKTDPSQLAGKSGKLKIKIKTAQNKDVDKIFYDNYMLQISVPMDMEKTDNIDSGGGTEALSGSTKLINYNVLPGGKGNFTLSADITDFEMDSIQINGIPFSMDFDMGDIDDLAGQFDDLADAMEELDAGVGELDDGIQVMDSGLSGAKSGSSKVNKGLKDLNKATPLLSTSVKEFNTAITTMSTQLNNNFNSGSIKLMVSVMKTISTGLNDISTNMTGILEGLKAARAYVPTSPSAATMTEVAGLSPSSQAEIIAYVNGANAFINTFDTYINTLTSMSTSVGAISKNLDFITSQLSNLNKLSDLQTGLTQLSTKFSAFNGYSQTYYSGVGSIAKQYSKLNNGISSASKGMSKMADGSGELSSGVSLLNSKVSDIPGQVQEQIDSISGSNEDFEPKSFISPFNTNINSVQFVMTTDKIKIEKKVAVESEKKENKKTVIDKIIELFS